MPGACPRAGIPCHLAYNDFEKEGHTGTVAGLDEETLRAPVGMPQAAVWI